MPMLGFLRATTVGKGRCAPTHLANPLQQTETDKDDDEDDADADDSDADTEADGY